MKLLLLVDGIVAVTSRVGQPAAGNGLGILPRVSAGIWDIINNFSH
jgi:hypothetical protein